MNEHQLPDYDDSILSIASSVLRHYGAEGCTHPSQPLLDEALKSNPRNVVVMLFDGMGVNLLQEHLPEDAFLRRHLAAPISSVFPPTTVAATTTIQTGMAPVEHGWLGWTLYFKEAGAAVETFSNRIAATGKPASEKSLAEKLLPTRSVIERVHEAAPDVDAELVSMRSRYHTISAALSCARTASICRKKGRHYIYCYWINPDHFSHQYGIHSWQVHRNILRINHEVEKMCGRLQDTVVAVTADHGLIDTKWVYLEDHPALCRMLSREPSMESRAASLCVQDGMQEEFRKQFREAFGDQFILLTGDEVLACGLLGEGKENPRVRGFIGDFLAIAVGGYSLGYHRRKHELIGMHAGMTRDELTVPLILYTGKQA